jgi:hypothetical protein
LALGAPPAINPSTRPTQTVRDIALGQGGVLSGKVLDAQGKAISNVPIQVQQEGHLIAHVVTDTSGQFSVRQLTGGIYSISTPNQQDSFRIWSADAAPPIAARAIEMTDGQIIRGQCEECGHCGRFGQFGCFSQFGRCGQFGRCESCGCCRVGSPWVLAVGIATVIAIPLALGDDDAS